MIVAIEGPSAAGKTTWCRTTGYDFVPEYTSTGIEPDGREPAQQAAYWTEVNSRRWSQALALEARAGLAICDSDPIKLHYSWCLARLGESPVARFDAELASLRGSMEKQRLGFPDKVLIAIPDEQTLRLQKTKDLTRSRRSFELHLRLRQPLIEWYQCLDKLAAGHVFWDLPAAGGTGTFGELPRRSDRYDLQLLDALIGSLPALIESPR